MIGPWLSDQGYLLGPALALGVFLAVFVVMLVWILRPGSARIYARQARLPFDEGRPAHSTHRSTAEED